MSLNPSKIVIVPFTRRRNLRDLASLTFKVETVPFAVDVKLGKGYPQSQTAIIGLRTQTNPLETCDDCQTKDHV